MKRPLFSLVLAMLVSGCIHQARLYEMESGRIMVASYTLGLSGAGTIWLGQKQDRQSSPCRGEYVTVPAGSSTWGSIYTSAGTSATASAVDVQSDQHGQAVLNCTDGHNYQCEYVTSAMTGHGAGSCIDSQRKRYRLMF
jgi:hypothetical protein